MDNVLFNVNGERERDLVAAIKLIYSTKTYSARKESIEGYIIDNQSGLVLLDYIVDKNDTSIVTFPSPMTVEELLPFIMEYLCSEQAKKVPLLKWEDDADHDGCNSIGWRVYVGDWGHIPKNGDKYTSYSGAICAIKRVYLWHGK